MPVISVETIGDRWCNPDRVAEEIKKSTGASHLVFDLNSEGPSLYALGIAQVIDQGISGLGLRPDQVWIDRWSNSVELVPYRRTCNLELSHFFWMSNGYRHFPVEPAQQTHPLALFVGRATVERAVIMWDLYSTWPNDVLMSLMHGHGSEHQSDVSEWLRESKQQGFRQWWTNPPVISITGHSVRDQYISGNNTNADLVAHYDRFAIEVVCETCCRGDTFFPTEKTVRPLSQRKPMLIFGPKKFLARLRELGFRTWGDIWDETYDDLEGAARWTAMKRSLSDILNQRLWLDERLPGVAQHNLKVLEYLITRYQPQ